MDEELDMAKATIATLDMTSDIRDYTAEIQRDIMKAATDRSLRDTDRLLLNATQYQCTVSMEGLRVAESCVRKMAASPMTSHERDTEEERVYRFTIRSYNIVRPHIQQSLLSISKSPLFGEHNIEVLRERLLRARRMLERTVDMTRKPESYHWTCHLHSYSAHCAHVGHFHTSDGLVWPNHDEDILEFVPLPSLPALTFRDCKYHPLPALSTWDHFLDSLCNAVAASSLHKRGKISRLSHTFGRALAEEKFGKEGWPECIESTTLMTFGDPADEDEPVHLGILLPGSSQFFLPHGLPTWSTRGDAVIIETCERKIEGKRCYRFRPIAVARLFQDTTQTVRFVDLPAEIRNMIYAQILEQEESHTFSHRQPAMSLTCRLANEELLSLLFKKRGWFMKA